MFFSCSEKRTVDIPANNNDTPTHTTTIEVPKANGCNKVQNESSNNSTPLIMVHTAPGIFRELISPPHPMVAKARNINQKPRKIGMVRADKATLQVRIRPNRVSMIPPASIHPRPVM